ncbi:MAG: hypothetical protein K6C40_03765 [Thermoguttaceae bacterium]|nr:hypothetical protein [Thermoguttaceae bacterium]
MSKSKKFTEEDFARFQNFFNSLPPEEHAEVVRDLIGLLYNPIHSYIVSMKIHDNIDIGRPTSFADSYTYALLKNSEACIVGPCMKAETLPMYLQYLHLGIRWFVSNKIRRIKRSNQIKDKKRNTVIYFVQPPIDKDTGLEIEFPDKYQPDILTQELALHLFEFLDKTLSSDKKELLEMRLGVRFPKNENESFCLNYKPAMKFREIAEEVGGGVTVDTVQHRWANLKCEIRETRAAILFFPDDDDEDDDEDEDT